MPLYRVRFISPGWKVYATEHFEAADDHAAVREALDRNVGASGIAFDLWQDDRLVHLHQNTPEG